MFKTAVIATALLQVSATKLEVEDYSTKALTSKLVEEINVRRNPIFLCQFVFNNFRFKLFFNPDLIACIQFHFYNRPRPPPGRLP